MMEQVQKRIAAIRENRPLCLALTLATLLYSLFAIGLLKNWSAMGRSYQFDHNTLGRCGLAIRVGTNIFTSGEDYQAYGYHGANWASLPGLCLLLGTWVSYLNPDFGFWVKSCSPLW